MNLHNVHDQATNVIIASVLLEVLRLAGLIPRDRDTASSLSFQRVVVVRQRQCGPKAAGLLTWLFATQPRGYRPRRTAGGLSAPPGRSRRLQRGIQRRRSAHRRRRRSRGPPVWQLRGQTPPMAGPAVTNRRPRRCRPGGNKNIQNSHVLPDQVDHSQLLRLGPDPAGVEASWPKKRVASPRARDSSRVRFRRAGPSPRQGAQ